MSSVLLMVASIIVIACIILPNAGVLGATNSGQTGTGGSAGLPTTAPTVAAFPTVAPTATQSGPQLISTAVLGGTRDAFTAAYGAPTFKGPIPWYTYTASDGSTITFCFCSGLDGKDGQQRLGNMGFGPADGASLTAQEANRLTPLFFPPDAKYQHDIHDPDAGTIHVYRSADLAASFPASDFTDSNSGAADPPGTFAVACDQPNVSPGCSLVVGT
jgi:hypothetical protein